LRLPAKSIPRHESFFRFVACDRKISVAGINRETGNF
jgi:hypothetical protein